MYQRNDIQYITTQKVETTNMRMFEDFPSEAPQIKTNMQFKKVVIQSDGNTVKKEEVSFGGDNMTQTQVGAFNQRMIEAGAERLVNLEMEAIGEKRIKKEIRLIPLNEKEMEQQIQKEKEKQAIEKRYQTMFNYDEEKAYEEQDESAFNKLWTFIKDSILLITAFSVDVIANCTIIYPTLILLTLYSMLKAFAGLCSSENKIEAASKILVFLFMILGSCATIFLQVMGAFYFKSDTIEKFWFLDALIFFMSTVLVCSYIKCIQAEISQYSEIFNINYFYGQKVTNTLFMTETSQDEGAYVYDCVTDNDNKIMLNEFKRIMKENQIQELAQRFNLFSVEQEPIKLLNKGVEIVMGCNRILPVQMSQYFALITIIALKTLVSLTYIFLQKQEFSIQSAISIVATTLFYINMTWCLNKVIGNYDLRRKVLMIGKVNSLIDFSTENQMNKKLIDATDSISFEAWDNTRKFVYQYFSSKLSKLEFVYVCLFFYYLFVTVICVVAYGEFYSIIPKESLYLQPLMVIQNSFDFIFLNAILFWRIYWGQQLNDSFEESENNLDTLIGMAEDLLQMFDLFFLPERKVIANNQNPNTYAQIDQDDLKSMNMANLTEKDDEIQKSGDIDQQNLSKIKSSTIYGQFVLRIKFLSHYYINNKVFYLGTLYDTNSKRTLQKEILKNMLNSFRKVKEQVKIDSRQYCYKFLNIFKLEFTDIITTIIVAFLSVLPNVIPKLIEIFQAANDNPDLQ